MLKKEKMKKKKDIDFDFWFSFVYHILVNDGRYGSMLFNCQ